MRPVRTSAAESRFLDMALAKCRAAKVPVRFLPCEKMPGLLCTGLFEWTPKRITIARYAPKWFQVFVHEFCHFEQAMDGLWISTHEENAFWTFEEWLQKRINPGEKRITECCRIIQACELDAEQRAVRYIREYKMPIDLEIYIKDANSYVLAYEASRQIRLWYKRRLVNPRIRALVPSTWLHRHDRLPKGFLDEYLIRCVKKRKDDNE